MTSEEYVRGGLLGGMHLSSLISQARGLPSNLAALRDPQAAGLLPESETLQRNARVGSKTSQESFEDWLPRLVARKPWSATGLRVTTHPEALRSLSQVSADAQWRSLRTDIWNRLEAVYSFRRQRLVRLFLEKHSFLTPLILQASKKIRHYGLSSKMVLEVSVDPDNGKHQELWVQIQTDLTPEVAIAKLARFDEEWWLEASAASGNLLNINLEYL